MAHRAPCPIPGCPWRGSDAGCPSSRRFPAIRCRWSCHTPRTPAMSRRRRQTWCCWWSRRPPRRDASPCPDSWPVRRTHRPSIDTAPTPGVNGQGRDGAGTPGVTGRGTPVPRTLARPVGSRPPSPMDNPSRRRQLAGGERREPLGTPTLAGLTRGARPPALPPCWRFQGSAGRTVKRVLLFASPSSSSSSSPCSAAAPSPARPPAGRGHAAPRPEPPLSRDAGAGSVAGGAWWGLRRGVHACVCVSRVSPCAAGLPVCTRPVRVCVCACVCTRVRRPGMPCVSRGGSC